MKKARRRMVLRGKSRVLETMNLSVSADISTGKKEIPKKVMCKAMDIRRLVFLKLLPQNVAVISNQYVDVISDKYLAGISTKYVANISNKYVAVISDKYVAVISNKYVVIISNVRRQKNHIFWAQEFFTISEPKLQILRPLTFHHFSIRVFFVNNLCHFGPF